MKVAICPKLVTRNKDESNIEFEKRVEELRKERGVNATAHKLGGANGSKIKGASRYIIAEW